LAINLGDSLRKLSEIAGPTISASNNERFLTCGFIFLSNSG
jgi:hypothetical protein